MLDAEQDIALLKFHGWELSCECARTLRISTMLLKKGAERGLTPFAIGSIMCRETLKKVSVIEEIVREAEESVLPGTSETAFLESVSQIMDRRLNELTMQVGDRIRDEYVYMHMYTYVLDRPWVFEGRNDQ